MKRLSLGLVLLLLYVGALACIHPPAGFKGALSEREKLAFLFHDGTNAHLVIQTTVSAAEGGLPSTIAWVLPIPSLPTRYEEASPNLFAELAGLIPRLRVKPAEARKGDMRKSEVKAAAPAPAIRVHEAQAVGGYKVQPVEILSESGGKELNAWLVKNGFDPVSEHDQKYYMKKGAVFVTLKIEGLKGQQSEVKPLHIVYRDDRMRLPLKMSGHSGVFDVRLYALTDQPPSRRALAEYGLEVRDSSHRINDRLPGSAPAVAGLVGSGGGYLTEFVARDYNRAVKVADLKEDPWLTKAGSARGGGPGGQDNAALRPPYPLMRIGHGNGATWPTTAGGWGGFAFLAAWLAGAALWLGVSARKAARAIRAPGPDRWRRLGNQSMLAGIALFLLAMAVYVVSQALGMWGLLVEEGTNLMPMAGIVVFLAGVAVRVAAIWVDREMSAPA